MPAKVAVANPESVTDAPLVVATPTGLLVNERIGPLRSNSVPILGNKP